MATLVAKPDTASTSADNSQVSSGPTDVDIVDINATNLETCDPTSDSDYCFYDEPFKAIIAGKSPSIEDEKWKQEAKENLDKGCEACRDLRGEFLFKKMDESLNALEIKKTDLIMVLTGSSHIAEAERQLGRKYHTVYFNEPFENLDEKGVIRHDVSERQFQAICAARYSGKPKADATQGKTDMIVYGEDHCVDYKFEKYFPTADTLKKRGVKRIIFCAEHIFPSKNLELKDLKSPMTSCPENQSYERFAKYLANLQSKGIEATVIGIDSQEASDVRPFIKPR